MGFNSEPALPTVMAATRALAAQITALHEATPPNEDFGHALLALEIVRHALHEVEEHRGLGGTMPHTPHPEHFQAARALAEELSAVRTRAEQLFAATHQEDLETALRALTLAQGSLAEVLEQYE